MNRPPILPTHVRGVLQSKEYNCASMMLNLLHGFRAKYRYITTICTAYNTIYPGDVLSDIMHYRQNYNN